MKVFLLKDVEKVGLQGEVIEAKEGFAMNFLIPRKLAIQVTSTNEKALALKIRAVENRKKVIESKTSMLAEKISSMKVTIARKLHDDDRLYGSISPAEVVDALAHNGVAISKSQVVFDKAIKSKGTFDVTIRLSSKLQPKVKLTIVAEK